ncbi:uncharacterized protein [Amphiura filiformis]|uniref:uncharacterized protein n=1 Tax=Amphiura filiformis TaxID=82378 RepID=UPI003B2258E6
MGKRRHQSSSVEEVSPVVTRRTSTRLTRSKKLKSTVKSSSPVLGKATVSIRQHQEVGNTRQQEAGPSAVKSSNRRSRLRLSNAHRLLDQDCITPVRPRHGRSHHLQLNSPHSESEPEIIWDDKSPNAVQLRRLGKGGKRNAIEDISDIINCVPEVTVDVNTKPSLLSLWMTRDSPSPKPAGKSTQGSNRVSKKSGGKKKARKSRLSALTHELEKVLNAIEPDEDVVEEDEESEEVVSSPEKLPLSKTAVTVSTKTDTVTARSTSPTLYTQTKPTQKIISPRRTPLPSVGHSPNTNADQQPKPNSVEKSEEKQPCKESKSTGSEESPPGSQTKWEAIGNESAEDLWGDDDLFEDDGLLMEAIEVEIASSQMVQSTPVRKSQEKTKSKRC